MSSIEKVEKEEFKPLIVAFCCNWCSYAGADLAGTSRLNYPANVKIIRVPCSCRVNTNFIIRAFQKGADGVVIAGCHPGDCHYSTGNYYTRRRFSIFINLLEYLGIEKERFKIDWISAAEANKFATVMNEVLNNKVQMVIGWEKGDFSFESTPVFITEVEKVDSLIFDNYCVNNLSKYLIEQTKKYEKIGVFLKGCDSLGFNQLLRDNRIERDKVYVWGIPCSGMLDSKNKKYTKCENCLHPNPVVYDELIGEEINNIGNPEERFREVKILENMNADERYEFWSNEFSRCIRCNACRNICPACSCVKCIFDNDDINVLGKANIETETSFFHLTRAYHVAGNCVDCGECARVCPAHIRLDLLNRKIIKDLNETYGEWEAGMDSTTPSPLVSYTLEDKDNFAIKKGGK